MDIWVERILAIGIIAVLIAMIYAYINGNDGTVLSILSGFITGYTAHTLRHTVDSSPNKPGS